MRMFASDWLDRIEALALDVTLAQRALNAALVELAATEEWKRISYQDLGDALGTTRQSAFERTQRLLEYHRYATEPPAD